MSTLVSPVSAMPQKDIAKPPSRLTLKSQLDDMALLWPWVEALALEYAIPEDALFGVHLCLEEAISNVIRHGYNGEPGHTLSVDCVSPKAHEVLFVIEDQAPPFDPVSGSIPEEQPASSPMDYLRPGGRGILLMRKFSGSLAYERLPGGNRLTIGFDLTR
ncbi:MAG TPA: ATP-binding protein [Terracidiphilus sp.]|nr:ATP-binding protein [Terracidiphilus sp.]